MNFIKALLDKGYITPAVARMIEIAVYSILCYLLGSVVEGTLISTRGAITAIAVPLLSYVSKRQRDLTK